jgi:hypothetical protein
VNTENLTFGDKLLIGSLPLHVVGFFLPWVTISLGGYDRRLSGPSYSMLVGWSPFALALFMIGWSILRASRVYLPDNNRWVCLAGAVTIIGLGLLTVVVVPVAADLSASFFGKAQTTTRDIGLWVTLVARIITGAGGFLNFAAGNVSNRWID